MSTNFEGGSSRAGSASWIFVPPFRLDPTNQQLWRGNRLVPLKPKAFSILCYLLERPHRLVAEEELLARFWGDVHVTEAVLKTQLSSLRKALGDCPRTPRFIETAHGRGYRFIAPIERAPSRGAPVSSLRSSRAEAASGRGLFGKPSLAGRHSEMELLDQCLAMALEGRRRFLLSFG